jgi:DNA polymerase III alpha subunit
MATYTFAPIRQELVRLGLSKSAIDNLELALREAIQEAEGSDNSTDLTELAATLREEIAAAVIEAVAKAKMLDRIPLTRDQILAIVDNAILTEDGDNLQTEAADNLLLESA